MINSDKLPKFGDSYRQYYNPDLEVVEIRRKSTHPNNCSVSEAMEFIHIFLRNHQTSYIPSKNNDKILLFPFMFKKPTEGDKITNTTTNEIYTIDQVINNPKTGKWEGLLKLDLVKKPYLERRESLQFNDQKNYIDFTHSYPSSISNLIDANTSDVMQNTPPMTPTITWKMVRMEPGGLGKPFDSRKEFKPRLRESLKDPLVPGYTVEVIGRTLDSIVQFDCWSHDHKTSERLVKWFENFLNTYTGYLRQCGVGDLFFWQRTLEDFNKVWRQSFAVRGTQFYFRTEELEASYERDLVRVDITLETMSSITPRLFKEHRYIADQLVTGELTYSGYRDLFYRSGEFLFGDIDIVQ